MGIITGMRIPRGRSRRAGVTAGLVVSVIVSASVLAPVAQEPQRSAAADWPMYNRDLAGTRYSPLAQINTRTVSSLREVWSYRFHPEDGFIEGPSPTELFQQVTPIVVDGVMYLPAGNRVVALRPETGDEIWRHELTEGLASFRGVTKYWPGQGVGVISSYILARKRDARAPHLFHHAVEGRCAERRHGRTRPHVREPG